MRRHPLASRLAEPAAQGGIFGHKQQCLGERRRVGRGNHKARSPIDDRFGIATDVGYHHRQSRPHRFENRIGEALIGARRQHAEIGRFEQATDIEALAKEAQIAGETLRRGKSSRAPA